MVTQETCWRQVLLLPPSPRCRLGRTPGHTSSAVTSTPQANAERQGPLRSGTAHSSENQATERCAFPAKARGWPRQQGRQRWGVHPGEGIPFRRLVFVGRKFDPPGAVGWCLRPFLSGLKKEFSICREKLARRDPIPLSCGESCRHLHPPRSSF